MSNENQKETRELVREGYAAIAAHGSWNAQATTGAGPSSACGCAPAGGCCGPATFSPEALAKAVGYVGSELEALPSAANMGLSCGNPTAIAELRAGEIVLDLGSGGGFDCFIAGPKVGSAGSVIGVDMTHEMISKARNNLAFYQEKTGLKNVEFRLGEIEHLPVADSSVDVVISNCVLNLSPDKPQVWREIARVLKPGGRVAISDLALIKPLPPQVVKDIEALVGCIAGAVLVSEMIDAAKAAGLKEIKTTGKRDYIEAMISWEDPLYKKIITLLPPGQMICDYVTSLEVRGVR